MRESRGKIQLADSIICWVKIAFESDAHVYEVRPRKDKRGVDLISIDDSSVILAAAIKLDVERLKGWHY